MKGELVAGYLASQREACLIPLRVQVWKALGHSAGGTAWMLPSQLEDVCSFFGQAMGSAEEVVARNTLFPAFQRFIASGDREKLLKHHVGPGIPSIATTVGLHNCEAFGRHHIGICESCLREDICLDGRPFWKRDFMLPGVDFCAKHGERLTRTCAACGFGLVATPNPGEPPRSHAHCNRGAKVIDVDSGALEVELELSHALTSFLDIDFARRIGYEQFCTLVADRARHLGLTREGATNGRRVAEMIEGSRYSRVLMQKGWGGIGLKKLHQVLRGEALPRNPIQSVLLLLTLFGGWKNLRAQLLCDADGPLIDTREASDRPAITEIGSLAERFFEPNLDVSMARHVHSRHIEFTRAGAQYRISQNTLLQGHRQGSTFARLRDELPLTRAALEKWAESLPAHRRRALLQLIKEGCLPLCPEDVSALPSRAVKRLLEKARANPQPGVRSRDRFRNNRFDDTR